MKIDYMCLYVRKKDCVHECVCASDRLCICVYMRKSDCMYVHVKKKTACVLKRLCTFICVCMKEVERPSICECERETVCICVCMCMRKTLYAFVHVFVCEKERDFMCA